MRLGGGGVCYKRNNTKILDLVCCIQLMELTLKCKNIYLDRSRYIYILFKEFWLGIVIGCFTLCFVKFFCDKMWSLKIEIYLYIYIYSDSISFLLDFCIHAFSPRNSFVCFPPSFLNREHFILYFFEPTLWIFVGNPVNSAWKSLLRSVIKYF